MSNEHIWTKRGRGIRFEEGKVTEVFTLVLVGTSEENWFKNSSVGSKNYTEITEKDLDIILYCEKYSKIKIDNLFDFLIID